MAIERFEETRSASARFVKEVSFDGKETLVTRAVANFKTTAPLQDVYDVVVAVASLYPYGLKNIFMTERCELLEA